MTQDKRQELSENKRALLEAIEGLASAYAQRQVLIPESAWQFWFDAAKQSTLADVRKAISDWGKASSKMMTPADLFKALQNVRSLKRDARAVNESKSYEPIAPEVAAEFENAMKRVANRALPPDAWAYRNRIKEAYGFHLCSFAKTAWRKALGLAETYNFEDTNGVFPLDEYPDERTSLYHDCQMLFLLDYEPKHGLNLVYDKELVFKRYPNSPKCFNGRGEVVRG